MNDYDDNQLQYKLDHSNIDKDANGLGLQKYPNQLNYDGFGYLFFAFCPCSIYNICMLVMFVYGLSLMGQKLST